MKKITSLLTFLVITATVYWSFSDLIPGKRNTYNNFSIENASKHLKNISLNPHYVGTKEHKTVQKYLIDELEKLGLKTEIQSKTTVNNKWFSATIPENIIAKIKGSTNGKALLLLSHYDSSPHSSMGASDSGSGVVTILEGLRVFLAKNKQPKNDIIILISDAEELGLLGAKSFVDNHPWAKNIGLVLNFEARGSGGPSYMLMETNGKNSKMIAEFNKANPTFPVANSLMYSIYKKLPNDTDLTVFREGADISGFNFAFIGDHFDYHTAQDSYSRLDKETLIHQADYFTSMLAYFSESDIENFDSKEDYVYVNFPFIKLLSYSYSWNIPLLIIAFLAFFGCLFFGIALNKVTVKGLFKSFFPFLFSLVLCCGISFGLWQLILLIHPQYSDILHGFTYNGYQYIFAFVCLNLWLLFKVYKPYFKKENPADLLIAPLTFWLIINVLILTFVEGASFFIIPVLIALLILAITIFLEINTKKRPLLFTVLSIPTIYIFAPMIKMFPVGLGLKNLFISALFLALLFGLLIPILYRPKFVIKINRLIGVTTIVLFIIATFNSGFDIDKKKPNSLVYVQNSEEQNAYFGTYNNTLDDFTRQVFNENNSKENNNSIALKSKYNTRFTYLKETLFKAIKTAEVTIEKDTIINQERWVNFTLTPQRKINKIAFSTTTDFVFNELKINTVLVNKSSLYYVKKEKSFLTYHFNNSEKSVSLQMKFDVNKTQPTIRFNEISYDLLTNKNFSFLPRTEKMMPMPFVTNDAIICSKTIKL